LRIIAWPPFHPHRIFHDHFIFNGERKNAVQDGSIKNKTSSAAGMLFLVDALHAPDFEAFHVSGAASDSVSLISGLQFGQLIVGSCMGDLTNGTIAR